MQRLPVDVVCEYRGARAASEFVREGRTIAVPPRLTFEHVWPDGEPTYIEIGSGQIDANTALDWSSLKPGDRVRVAGEAILQERGSDRDSYFRLRLAELVKAAAAPVAKVA